MIEIRTYITESEGESFVTYGIKTENCEYPDLCTNRKMVEAFVEKIIRYDGFSLLENLVEDFIEEIYGVGR